MVRLTFIALIMAMFSVNVPAVLAAPLASDSAETGAVDGSGSDSSKSDADHAETPGLLSINPGAAIWNLLIFLLVLFVLGMFVWPPILTGLQAREDKIRADLQGAEQANLQAQATLAGYQKQLGEAQSKVQDMLAEARRDAEVVGAKIVEEAKADAERQRVRSLADIESAKVAAVTELANQTSDLAMALARQVVGRELNANDHADLIRQSLDRLPSSN
jgi:F-type H+-transporting ATPase subunit b